MKRLIVYKSIHHGNTKKLASTLAKALDADLLSTREATPKIIGRYNLIGFGSGIYFGKHHQRILDLAADLPKVNGKKAFIFSTSGIARIPIIHNFNKELKTKLLDKGYKVVGELSCRGFDTYGPLKFIGGIKKGRPNEEDLEEAKKFAQELLK
ncbi:flavodoxin family protein [Halonatronum saccharophilum]|uniref:flavodoxin family protein n=1 Tax=Halonatronum saccharophilum TaxID=150060 RepID=UPI000483578C|nr:flavodoxin family protein [Halonatronum saccharophilum]